MPCTTTCMGTGGGVVGAGRNSRISVEAPPRRVVEGGNPVFALVAAAASAAAQLAHTDACGVEEGCISFFSKKSPAATTPAQEASRKRPLPASEQEKQLQGYQTHPEQPQDEAAVLKKARATDAPEGRRTKRHDLEQQQQDEGAEAALFDEGEGEGDQATASEQARAAAASAVSLSASAVNTAGSPAAAAAAGDGAEAAAPSKAMQATPKSKGKNLNATKAAASAPAAKAAASAPTAKAAASAPTAKAAASAPAAKAAASAPAAKAAATAEDTDGEASSISEDEDFEDIDEDEDASTEGKKTKGRLIVRRIAASSAEGHRALALLNGSSSSSSSSSKTGSLFACRVTHPSADIASAEFDPALFDVKANSDACGNLYFSVLSDALKRVEELKNSGAGSAKKQALILTNLFRIIIFSCPQSLGAAAYFCLNRVAADFLNVETGVGDALVLRAMADTYGASEANLKKELRRLEDLGLVAEHLNSRVRTLAPPCRLSIHRVFSRMQQIATCNGKAAQMRKKGLIRELLVAAKGSEPRFITRFLQQRMRVGCGFASVYQAIAFAFCLTHNARGNFPAIGDVRTFKGSEDAFLAADLEPALMQQQREAAAEVAATAPPPPREEGRERQRLLLPSSFAPPTLELMLSRFDTALRRALCELPFLDLLLQQLLRGAAAETLSQLCPCTPGVPLLPMLARPTKGYAEVAVHLKDTQYTCEFKYDGERIQVHVLPLHQFQELQKLIECHSNKGLRAAVATSPLKSTVSLAEKGEKEGSAINSAANSPLTVRLFSRSQEDVTDRFPDLSRLVLENLASSTQSCVLDAEVVAYDPEQNQLLPFQVLSTRRRKGVEVGEITVQVALFLFDCMHLNGVSALDKPLKERRELLHSAIHLSKNPRIQQAKHRETRDEGEFRQFLMDAIKSNCEGLMVKSLGVDAPYEPSRRCNSWLKVKKDYVEGLTDTVDLVPIGAFYGKGKRSGVFGAYLLAVYDSGAEVFQSTCKAGTGFSNEELQSHYERLKDHTICDKKPYFDCELEPDVWLDATEVWECAAADLSISPVHTASRYESSEGKGVSLRFPRFLRLREDKKPEQATTARELWCLYLNQFKHHDDPKDLLEPAAPEASVESTREAQPVPVEVVEDAIEGATDEAGKTEENSSRVD
ncbi:DNA ligase 1 [Cyclospora cayetanensis]|uniref:DNA ligase n=1 Tax=Cyclospora cayetanensis TaxID=88456 RepID=A0A6P6S090_9EIME|nr:DNA ligase 1 [Cyclospora cayetanensis]